MCAEEVILAEERTTEEERLHILEARRRAAAKKKKLKNLGKKISMETDDEADESGLDLLLLLLCVQEVVTPIYIMSHYINWVTTSWT